MNRNFLNHGFLATFILATICAWIQPAQAQVEYLESRTAKQIIESYGSFDKAVLSMTREEWEVVRAWEEFDEVRYLTVLREYKDSFSGEREKRKELRLQKVMQNDACGCWVEPDDSYTRMVPPPGLAGLGPNEMAWFNQGGAGWDVDCSSEPIAISNQSDPWVFELYGEEYSFFYINSKGQISFGGDVIDWTPQVSQQRNTTKSRDIGKTPTSEQLGKSSGRRPRMPCTSTS